MTDALYLRFAAPLQSWALGRITGNSVQSEPRPTRSGIQGLVAASMGWRRGEWEPWIDDLEVTIRTDQPGHRHEEFQTINPRIEDLEYQRRIYQLMTGRRWSNRTHFTPDGQNKTSIVRRTYLANAAFLVELKHDRLDEVGSALLRPVFTQYLGKKAFAPTFPFVLGIGKSGLLQRLPTWNKKQVDPADVVYDEWFEATEVPDSSANLRIDEYSGTEHTVEYTDVESLPWVRWLETVAASLQIPTVAA